MLPRNRLPRNQMFNLAGTRSLEQLEEPSVAQMLIIYGSPAHCGSVVGYQLQAFWFRLGIQS
jgi:hypothetical protein